MSQEPRGYAGRVGFEIAEPACGYLAGAANLAARAYLEPMNIVDAIASRRSVKHFTARTIARGEVERLLDAAVQAPNHRLTQPWRFYVLGPAARRAYGTILGARKAKKVEDPAAARVVIEKVAGAEAAIPMMIAVSVLRDENPEIREEDYAATMMAIQNILLAARAMGLGTHLKSGAVMDDPRTRELLGVSDAERIIALIQVGEPGSEGEASARRPAGELTTWLP